MVSSSDVTTSALTGQNTITCRLLDWYDDNQRRLPWRGQAEPYAIWVSEIMLQQTQVETVIPYFERWMKRFPTLADLAKASQQEVLQVWEGLGYYSRARNLHRAAQQVMDEYGGEIPADRHKLESLAGIGRYTAGAIASIAFQQDEAVLDGNVRRVFSRLFDITLTPTSSAGNRLLWNLARQYLPPGNAENYNQALMDLGALICTPHQPACERCPLEDLCQARALGVQEERPVAKVRPAIPHHTVTAAIIWREGRVLITRRPPQGLLGGMWEFPGGKLEPGEELTNCLEREIKEELGVGIAVGQAFGIFHHAYTHFRVTLHAFYCELTNGEPQLPEATELSWVKPDELCNYPMGKIDRLISRQLNEINGASGHA